MCFSLQKVTKSAFYLPFSEPPFGLTSDPVSSRLDGVVESGCGGVKFDWMVMVSVNIKLKIWTGKSHQKLDTYRPRAELLPCAFPFSEPTT